jgi:formylglycine-generating enzyme required for sulfatase activity
MNTKKVLCALAFCLSIVALCFAADDNMMGTWKLNDAKSKISSGTAKNHTVMYEAAGDSIKVTVDGEGPDGKPAHNEWTGKFDGKDYPVTGDTASDSRSYKRVNPSTLQLTNKKEGKVVAAGKIVVSKDGKTRTVTISGTTSDGKKYKSVGVYDKQ